MSLIISCRPLCCDEKTSYGKSAGGKGPQYKSLSLFVMKEQAADAQISFEADPPKLRQLELPATLSEPTPALTRNTLWPMQDIVFVPLEPSGIKRSFKQLAEQSPMKSSIYKLQKPEGWSSEPMTTSIRTLLQWETL